MDGGLSMGLAFLSEIQVFMFMEAAQVDRRTNVMQAPKITVFNGQTANITVQDQQFFLTGVQLVQAGAQVFFVPNQQPFPLGVQLQVTPVVSADRRFVRVNLQPTLTNLASTNVPLIPVQIPVPQLFEGPGAATTSGGQPVIFQMFFQQPTLTQIQLNTTVSVPDGGTVLLGGLKTLSEGRTEAGPPILSKIPYINRLFRNTAYGRDSQSLLIMVTPRIIINEEEERIFLGDIPPIPRDQP
jgi:type II secretory pathway component GspD/PulD (secretin)